MQRLPAPAPLDLALPLHVAELQTDAAHEIGTGGGIVVRVQTLISHRPDSDIDTGNRLALAERIVNPLRQLAVLKEWRFGRAAKANRQILRLEVGPEQPQHRVNMDNLSAKAFRLRLALADLKEDVSPLRDQGVDGDRGGFVVLAHAALRCQ